MMKPHIYSVPDITTGSRWVVKFFPPTGGQVYGYGVTIKSAWHEMLNHTGALALADARFKELYPEASQRYESQRQA
jgi:hypothetical protein